MKHFLLFLLLLPLIARAQVVDNFADGDFTNNPTWTGDTGNFLVTSQQLQSNGPAVTGSQIQLVTPCQAGLGTTWEFWANIRNATTSGNLADVWLMASQADLKSTSTKGYFVRLGGTGGKVSLFRKDSARTALAVIDGQTGSLSATNNLVRVRVTHLATGQWTLSRDLTGGTSFVAEPNSPAFDNTYQRSVAVGVSLLYSAANGKNYYFDDFNVSDTTPPLLTRAAAVDARTVDLVFNEVVDPATAAQVARYRLSTGVVPVSAQISTINPAVVRLSFGQDFLAANTIEARQIADLYGNTAAGPLTASFGGAALTPRRSWP
ncbi:MAG: hypothetical protein EOO59_18100 [Hymenobacter sp.]|nr:MAG: hypothetical protein EOO59_18100 [Hymenobacter sp.]